ncbi:hypothetical protein MTR_5g069820 [Medicago truncatula]|uniref:Uncharacterized protein n=1 Tax=Medicago truncatula TaxID=3880 RepID=G7K6A9_MEDTR|nr:hypothetical protein MTR_5g069820 [Medicago truncatula]
MLKAWPTEMRGALGFVKTGACITRADRARGPVHPRREKRAMDNVKTHDMF